ncbi:MAG: cupin [Leptolyngbyaceae cyanobacterium SM1_1_3]|nr:cupin [Leptolyngbyaceae cyanobacterium SM1_1_3]
MENQAWVALETGQCESLDSLVFEQPDQTYRLYRFLTELEDILAAVPDDYERIRAIAPLVQKLLVSSYWLQMEYHKPSEQGWAVNFLYREHQFPLTVQMVTWAPKQQSTIHNHATWGIVAMIGGQEKNTLWQRCPSEQQPDKIQLTEERVLQPGDIMAFMPGAIHCVEPVGDEMTVSFNLYGVTDYSQRYQFDPLTQTAKKF